MKGKKVFISYVKEDAETAEKLYNDLKSEGVKIWTNDEDILPGQGWRREIERAIKEDCSYFLLLLSSKSISKKCYEHKQMRIALNESDYSFDDNNIFIIPVRLDDCDITTNDKLKYLQCVDLFDSYEEGLKKIITEVILPGKKYDEGKYDKNSDKIQSLLPYLVNRKKQVTELRSMVEKYYTEIESKHHLSFIIHGYDDQSHNMFIECLEEYYWKQIHFH